MFAAGIAAARAGNDVVHTHYDGVTNDLLTAGLGKTGLGSPVPPGFVDPLHPTAEELRRLAIYNNYRALIDPTPGGGYGTLYGPNVKADGTVTASEGLIAGDEYIAYEKGGDGRAQRHHDGADPGHVRPVATPASSRRPPPARAASMARSRPPASGGSSAAAPSPIPTRAPAPARTTCRPTPST